MDEQIVVETGFRLGCEQPDIMHDFLTVDRDQLPSVIGCRLIIPSRAGRFLYCHSDKPVLPWLVSLDSIGFLGFCSWLMPKLLEVVKPGLFD